MLTRPITFDPTTPQMAMLLIDSAADNAFDRGDLVLGAEYMQALRWLRKALRPCCDAATTETAMQSLWEEARDKKDHPLTNPIVHRGAWIVLFVVLDPFGTRGTKPV